MDEKYMELYEKLSKLQWLLQRSHLQNHAEHGPAADPTRGQGRVLKMLRLQPEISTKDLSYLLGIRQQSLNELLNKLEKAGYVVRTPSEADRRVMLVSLTEKGKNESEPGAEFTDIFDCLSAEERTAFGEYLDRIITALEGRLGDDDDDERFNWMRGARARMGDEQFERLMREGRHFGGRGMGRGMWGGAPHGHHGPDFDPRGERRGGTHGHRGPDFDPRGERRGGTHGHHDPDFDPRDSRRGGHRGHCGPDFDPRGEFYPDRDGKRPAPEDPDEE